MHIKKAVDLKTGFPFLGLLKLSTVPILLKSSLSCL